MQRCIMIALLSLLFHGELQAAEDLPVGADPHALDTPHFPDRLHAFIWRNWQLIEPSRLAQVIGTSAENVEQIAASMGLPAMKSNSSRMRERGYITLIRRNWHLLPYDQLLTLLDIKSAELAHSLREDDFLFIKLGSLKPKCDPLRYQKPDDAARRRAAEIRRVVAQHFGQPLNAAAEPRFHFIDELSRLEKSPPQTKSEPTTDGLRLIYSYFGSYGDPLSDPTQDPYPDGLLAKLADMGVNGVWLHVMLRQLAPGGDQFTEFGEGHKQRLANLRKLVDRARRHGIGVYLYINEPRSMPVAFFGRRERMAGVREGDFVAMCTSQEDVRKWLSDSLAHVFREVPGLAGVFTITASENLTNCASHRGRQNCPRCRHRTEAEIIAEVNAAIAEGVHRGNPRARVIAYDWGWNNHGDASETIALLPQGIDVMSVSEWSLPIKRGGVAGRVGEYSLSAVGPGPRATRHWALAKQAGLKTIAKVQFNTTWEMSAVPYLPVLDLVAEHCQKLAAANIDGMMLSWTVGGYPSPNLLVARHFCLQPGATPKTVLDAIAAERYGEAAAPHARRAWTAFSEAFRHFPYDGRVLYMGPQQMGPANPLYAQPTGFRATMVGIPYDDLESWRGNYPPEVLADLFDRVATGWAEGLAAFHRVVEATDGNARDRAVADERIARAAQLHFASAANQTRFIIARAALLQRQITAEQRERHRAQIRTLINREIALARELFTLTRHDSRIGFEASNHYYYVPLDLVEKVISCEFLRNRFATAN